MALRFCIRGEGLAEETPGSRESAGPADTGRYPCKQVCGGKGGREGGREGGEIKKEN